MGFVSNSSSSSFILKKDKIPKLLKMVIENGAFQDMVNKFDEEAAGWDIKDRKDHFLFDTSMDNFDMISFLTNDLGVDASLIEGEDTYE